MLKEIFLSFAHSAVMIIKDHRRLTANKRLEKIKMMKGEKVILDDIDDDEIDDDQKKEPSVSVDRASVVVAPQKNENPVVESVLV